MQDSKHKNNVPDADILQSKADLRELLRAAGLPEVKKAPEQLPEAKSLPADASVIDSQPSEEILLDAELAEIIEDKPVQRNVLSARPESDRNSEKSHLSKSDTKSEKPVFPDLPSVNENPKPGEPVVHIFHAVETSEKKQEPTAAPQAALVEKLQQAHQKVEKELWDKTRLLEQQQQRLTFLEQQLQNAIVLERAKSRFQQEAETLKLENQQLSAEITQLKRRLEDLYGTDAEVQRLRNELGTAQAGFSEQQSLASQVKQAMQVLQNELAAYKQKAHESQTRQSRHEQQLADMNADYQRLRDEHEQALARKTAESAEVHRQKQAELKKTAGQMDELRVRYHQLQGDFDQIRHEYEAFQAQANEEIHMLTESTDVLTDENARLSDEIHQVEAQKQQLHQTLKKLQAGEQQVQQIREQLQQEHQLSDDLRHQIERLEAEVSHVQAEKETLVEQLHALQSNQKHLQEEIEQRRDATADMDVLQQKLDESHDEVRRLSDENQSLQKQLETLQAAASIDEIDEIQDSDMEPVFSGVESGEQHVADRECDDEIPVFNLADQIMEAHRRSVAGRRQRVNPAASAHKPHSIKDVVAHYIPAPAQSMPPEKPQTAPAHHPWTDQSLTPFQREILREIVRQDMELSRSRYIMTDYSPMHN